MPAHRTIAVCAPPPPGARDARSIAAAVLAAGAASAVACGPRHAQPIVDPPEGISIAVYLGAGQGYAVVDDRRTIEVTGRRVLLDRIESSAALATLVIEPLGAARGALAIDQCARERLRLDPDDAGRRAGAARPAGAAKQAAAPPEPAEDPSAAKLPAPPGVILSSGPVEGAASPLVACTVSGAPGRYRVRVHYVATAYGFQTRHEIEMAAPDRATVSTRFTVPTPAWGVRGEVVLHEGVPGAGEPPREIGRGPVALDGGVAVLALPPREVPARLVRVYDGMIRHAGVERTDRAWGKDSQHDVGVQLELDDAQLLRAPAHVRISLGGDTYEVVTAYAPEDAAGGGAATAGSRRLPLWIDPLLRGTRKRSVDRMAGASFADRFELTISNTGGEQREVWIEEPLRPARRRELGRVRAAKPELAGDVARVKVVVGPGQIERLEFTVRYAF